MLPCNMHHNCLVFLSVFYLMIFFATAGRAYFDNCVYHCLWQMLPSARLSKSIGVFVCVRTSHSLPGVFPACVERSQILGHTLGTVPPTVVLYTPCVLYRAVVSTLPPLVHFHRYFEYSTIILYNTTHTMRFPR